LCDEHVWVSKSGRGKDEKKARMHLA
jgi:hypothetical protein